MEGTPVILFVLAAAAAIVNSLPVGTGERSSLAVTALRSLQYRGETVVRRDQLPEEMRQVLENRQMLHPESEKEVQGDAPAADGDEGSSDAAGNLGKLSPAILAFLSSSGISKKEVLNVTRHLQHLDARLQKTLSSLPDAWPHLSPPPGLRSPKCATPRPPPPAPPPIDRH
ncbi:hypothetical protein E2C01_049924 [Portunus trituberculatus]|uniref:Uncharacterized protein n=1 Tax=Portunus trituberculatus TaxID=210409 RepID=A0A5B7GF36_PORTR|nr:hypothetical protein [Portunus trituberculatus]